MYYVYILYSRTKDRYYVGYTHNIEIRLSKHNAGATPSTRGGRPWELVYSEEYIDKSSALFREREIKSKKSRKYIEHLVAKGWSVPIQNREGPGIMPRSRYKKSDEFHHSFIFIKMYYVYILYSVLVDN